MRRRQFLRQAGTASLLGWQLGTTRAGQQVVTGEEGSAARRGPIEVGAQRQLLVDDFFFARQDNIKLTLHPPTPREVVLQLEKPWEKKCMHYSSVLYDGGTYRMWYRVMEGGPDADRPSDLTWLCYAESADGIHWKKPDLGLVSRQGSRDNNIVWPPEGKEKIYGVATCIILDPNPHAPVSERFKMIAVGHGEIRGYVSADGFHWQPASADPLLTEKPFDSQNIVLWDDEAQRYLIYCRGVDKSVPGPFSGGRRAIRRSESADFRHWSHPEVVVAGDPRDPNNFHLYTNAAVKYFRAARAFLMFPMILYVDRTRPGQPNLEEKPDMIGLSDVIFASSRDGIHWKRRCREPFLNPGLDERDWVDRNPIMGVGIVPTGPDELSLYYSQLYRSPASSIRRCTLRPDGFMSVEGPYEGWGEFTTHPLNFSGKRLELNYCTSGGGTLLVELQSERGEAIPGFGLGECEEIVGNKLEGVVRWKGKEDVSGLAGQPVRLRVKVRDAHLYAFQFQT